MEALKLLSYFGEKLQFELIYPQDLLSKKLEGKDEHKTLQITRAHTPKRMFGTFKLLYLTLEQMNQAGWGVYFTVNEFTDHNERKDIYFKQARAVWLEDDGETKGGLTDPTKFPLPPSSIIQSSPGKFHYYWFTRCDNADEWQNVMDNICETYGGDPGGKLKVQVLRVPGFKNTKGEYGNGPLVVIVGGNFRTYGWDEIKQHFPIKERREKEREVEGEVEIHKSTLDVARAIREIVLGESIYPNVLRLAASFAVKGVNRRDNIQLLTGIIDASSGEEHRKFDSKIKLPKTVDDAINKYNLERARVAYEIDNIGEIYTTLPWPPGLVGDVARWVNSTMQYPSPEIAIAAAFHVTSLLGGGCYYFEGLSVARARTILGENGRGKQSAADSIQRLMAALPLPNVLDDFIMREAHSPFNYQADINRHKIRGMINSEAGIIQSSGAGDQQNKAAWKLKALSQQIGGDPLAVVELSRGSTKNIALEKVLPVYDPIFILLDESTPETYMPMATKQLHIENGAMARAELFFIRPEEFYNEDAFANKKVPMEFIEKYTAMVNHFREQNVSDGLDNSVSERMVHANFDAIKERINKLKHDNVVERSRAAGKPVERAVVVRYVEKIICTTLILAIADSVDLGSLQAKPPVATDEHLTYAIGYHDEIRRCILANNRDGQMANVMDQALNRLMKHLTSLGSDPDDKYLSNGNITMQWLARKYRSNEKIMTTFGERYRYNNHLARIKIMEEACDRGMVVPVVGVREQWKSLVNI